METIAITIEEFNELQDRYSMLLALEAAGVDNWEGYDIAMDIYEEYKNE